jgi:DNA topoisomerase III
VDAAALASPALTGEWEFALNQVALGKRARDDVRDALVDYTREVTNALTGFEHDTLYAGEKALGKCPECGSDVVESVWGYRCVKNERDAETRSCEFMIWKDRFGRYIDRTLVERLLRERTVGPIDGFVDRSGREVLKGTLTLKKDDEKGWFLDTKFGAPAAAGEAVEEGAEQVVAPSFPCPVHADCQIIETNFRWVCSKLLDGTEKSGPVLLKKVCLRDIEPEEAAAYFGEAARTSLLEGFTSRRGRPFKGMIIRKPTGKHGFEFPEREPRPGRKGAAPAAEGDAPEKKAKGKAAKTTKAPPKAKGAAKATKAKAKAKPKAPKAKPKAKGKAKGVEAEAV